VQKFITVFILGMAAIATQLSPSRQNSRFIASESPRPVPSPQRVMLLAGGGLETAMYLGMLDGAREAGKSPDIIIGTCGGSIAAALAHSVPEISRLKTLIESEELYHAFNTISVVSKYSDGGDSPFSFISGRAGAADILLLLRTIKAAGTAQTFPDLFSSYVLNVPMSFGLKELSGGFSASENSGAARIVIVGSKIWGGADAPTLVGQPSSHTPLVTETYFSDPATIAQLKDFSSPIGAEFPLSSVAKNVNLESGFTLEQAVRASISDPFYMQPEFVKGSYYTGGVIDLYPVELAKALSQGGEIIAPTASDFSTDFAVPAFQAAFGFNENNRMPVYLNTAGVSWVELSDYSSYDFTFDPLPNLANYKGLTNRFPKTYSEYVTKVRSQWEYGRQRAVQALQ
jgi:hypothetical protein